MALKGLMPIEGPAFEKRPTKTKATGRKERYDKTHPIKFPIVPEHEESLIYFFKFYKKKYEIPGIAEFCTFLLRYALHHPRIIDYEIEYVPLTRYKRVYVNQIERDKINGLHGYTTIWRLTQREVVHRLVMSSLFYLQGGGEIKFDEALPLKPAR